MSEKTRGRVARRDRGRARLVAVICGVTAASTTYWLRQATGEVLVTLVTIAFPGLLALPVALSWPRSRWGRIVRATVAAILLLAIALPPLVSAAFVLSSTILLISGVSVDLPRWRAAQRVPPLWSTAAVTLAGSVGLAIGYVISNHGFGAGDLYAMGIWSLPLGGIVRLAMCQAAPRLRAARPRTRHAVLALLGGVLGYLWTAAVALTLGSWFLLFSFPVLFCWIAGGVLGGGAAAWLIGDSVNQRELGAVRS